MGITKVLGTSLITLMAISQAHAALRCEPQISEAFRVLGEADVSADNYMVRTAEGAFVSLTDFDIVDSVKQVSVSRVVQFEKLRSETLTLLEALPKPTVTAIGLLGMPEEATEAKRGPDRAFELVRNLKASAFPELVSMISENTEGCKTTTAKILSRQEDVESAIEVCKKKSCAKADMDQLAKTESEIAKALVESRKKDEACLQSKPVVKGYLVDARKALKDVQGKIMILPMKTVSAFKAREKFEQCRTEYKKTDNAAQAEKLSAAHKELERRCFGTDQSCSKTLVEMAAQIAKIDLKSQCGEETVVGIGSSVHLDNYPTVEIRGSVKAARYVAPQRMHLNVETCTFVEQGAYDKETKAQGPEQTFNTAKDLMLAKLKCDGGNIALASDRDLKLCAAVKEVK